MVPSTFVGDVFYLLLLIVEFLLHIVYSISICAFNTLHFTIGLLTNMTESTKKQKRKHDQPNQTVSNRGLINANWQKFLSSNLKMDKKIEKPAAENPTNKFTGTFRRARKKWSKNTAQDSEIITGNGAKNAIVDFPDVKDHQGNSNTPQITKFIAMDCEMVGVGFNGDDHMLARVSLVNKFGDCIYDKFVKAREEVTDYRTSVSGIRKEDMMNGQDFSIVQKEVAEIIRGKILVGHSLKNDLSVLFLMHPKRSIRDTSRYKPFRSITKGSTPSLKRLAKEILNIDIQSGEHSSVEDARAAMTLYNTVAKNWEAILVQKGGYSKIKE